MTKRQKGKVGANVPTFDGWNTNMQKHFAKIVLLVACSVCGPTWAQIHTQEEARAHDLRVARAYSDVSIGDTKERVLEVAGEPATTVPAAGEEDEKWIYFSSHHLDVSLSFKDGKVVDKVQRFINMKNPAPAKQTRF